MAPTIFDNHLMILTTTFFASLFLFLLFYSLHPRSKKKIRGSVDETLKVKSGNDVDIIIVGAGVAGAALAHTLGKQGRRVLVIERDLTQPDRIVGEILQPGGYAKLIELGLEDCVEEIDAQRVFGYAMFRDGKRTKLSYSILFKYLDQFRSGIAGRSFHNGRFVQRLREKASSLPNVRMEQGTVTSLVEEDGVIKGVQYKTKEGQELKSFAPLTIVCDGCFSNFRRSLCKSEIEVPSSTVGLVLENCQLPFPNHGHFIIAEPSPAILYPISSSEVRCLIDIPGSKLPSLASGEMAKYLKTALAPQLPIEIQEAFISAVEKCNMRTMPNRIIPADPISTPGALLLGDAFNTRHPLTGIGMTVALYDIVIFRDLLNPLLDLTNQESLSKTIELFYTLRKPVASTINIIAGVLYRGFLLPPDDSRNEIWRVCFDYISLGGVCSSGPLALLSGLDTRLISLVLHFFAMVIFGAGRLLLPQPSLQRVWLVARMVWTTSRSIYPVLIAERVWQIYFPRALIRAPPR